MLHALMKVCPGTQGKMHGRLPDHLLDSGRIIAGSVRNPWDWYVSIWAYGCSGEGILYERLAGRRQLAGHGYRRSVTVGLSNLLYDLCRSRRIWRKAYADPSSPEGFRRWLHAVMDPSEHRALGEDYHISTLSRMAGFYTYRYCRLFHRSLDHLYDGTAGDPADLRELDSRLNIVDVMLRTEDLTGGILGLLEAAGEEVSDALAEELRGMERTNPSRRESSTEFYYDRASSDLVMEKDSLIIEKYGYSPPL